MALTHIDCDFFRGKDASGETSSYVALNPSRKPGSLVFACASAARESISSQVACRLSIEHFLNGVLEYYETPLELGRTENIANYQGETEISLEVLEAAFRTANTSVYNFGHKLAAGGRMAASLLGIVLEENVAAAGRVGVGTAYLFRKGDLFPFFEARKADAGEPVFVGCNSLLTVELASVPVQASDTIVLLPADLSSIEEATLLKILKEQASSPEGLSRAVACGVFAENSKVPFCLCANIGPEAIYLEQEIISPDPI